MNLVQTSVLSGIAVITRLATSLFLNKILAVYVGPSGYAVIGQLQSLISIATTFASGAVNTGVTKYTAEHIADEPRQHMIWGTAATLGLCCTALPSLVLVFGHGQLSEWLLGSAEHSLVLVWLACALPLLVLNSLLLAILNGRKAVGPLVAANIGGNLIGAVFSATLVMRTGLPGALIALAAGQAIACGWTVWLTKRTLRLRLRSLAGQFDRTIARSLGGFALMAATSAVLAPISHMIIRDYLASRLGWHTAGLWQALWKISEMHLLLLTSTLSVYFLPRFSEIREGEELRREVLKGYRFVLPIVAVSGTTIYLLREPLVIGLLTPDFLPLVQVLGIQLMGDAMKIGSWVIAFTMLSHAQTRSFVLSEVIFTALLVALTFALTPFFGLKGAAAAYALTYTAYGWAVYRIFGRLVARLRRTQSAVILAAGTSNSPSCSPR